MMITQQRDSQLMPPSHVLDYQTECRDGFRHVQHVPPNRGPTKRGSPQKHKIISFYNSSVHCSTGPQQNVDDDYCACRGRGVFIY